MEFVVDVQGFKKPINEFVFKELAVTSLEDDAIPSVYLFEPPFVWSSLPAKYKSENLWLKHNYLGISWNDGNVPYYEFEEILYNIGRCASKIHVKGLEKKRWLQKYMNNVYNIEDLGCPKLQKLERYLFCNNHQHCKSCWRPNCAARNALALKEWLNEYYEASAADAAASAMYVDSKKDDSSESSSDLFVSRML